MKKRTLLTGLIALALSTSTLSAFDLKSNMLMLNAELNEVQQGFMTSNQEGVSNAIKRFAKNAQDLLGNKDKFASMLPKGKEHRATEALNSARIISHNVQIIEDAIANKHNVSERKRREESQRAYTYIEHACFNCHNIVRDN